MLKTRSCVFKLGLVAENQKDLTHWYLRESLMVVSSWVSFLHSYEDDVYEIGEPLCTWRCQQSSKGESVLNSRFLLDRSPSCRYFHEQTLDVITERHSLHED